MKNTYEGSWGEGVTWKVRLTEKLPPANLVTAVFCVAITADDEIVIARSKRGWGLLGGHIENGESIIDALERECLEEGGFHPLRPRQFAVMEITAEKPVQRLHQTDKFYPFPTSYQVYFWATTDSLLSQPYAEEILEARSLPLDGIKQLELPDYFIIELGFTAYQKAKATP